MKLIPLWGLGISHNLFSFYGGYTIDFADYNKIINLPFYPFLRDSDGGAAGFFYPVDIYGRRDIVFNCSYTSLYFTIKENDGTKKYYCLDFKARNSS